MKGRINLFHMTLEGLEELEALIMEADERMAETEAALHKARQCAYQLGLVVSPKLEFDEE